MLEHFHFVLLISKINISDICITDKQGVYMASLLILLRIVLIDEYDHMCANLILLLLLLLCL